MSSIGRLFDRPSSSVYNVMAATGGISPAVRKRSRLALSTAERETISRGLASDQSMRCIAADLGRSPSTISREISRNGGQDSYRATQADQAAWRRAH